MDDRSRATLHLPRRADSTTIRPEPMPAEAFAVVAAEVRGGDTGVTLGEVLGRGGIGVVRLAQQASLGRAVAAKQLQARHRQPALEHALLREAWVIGALEHPNIVPIHDVTVDGEDRLTLLLKRVEGRPWDEYLADESLLMREHEVTDALDWHLSVLAQVCQAVAFAHTRGVLHRDIKPDNVMIGPFGEVVLLDWGIAAGLSPDAPALPPAAEQVVGTPVYMAPEMWSAPETVDERTDVFLLGATLFEVLCGAPPFRGLPRGDVEALRRWKPRLPIGVPAELRRLVRVTLSFHPSERPSSAQEVRQALERFSVHRGSMELTEGARRLTLRLADIDAREVPALFDEARFGFRAALRQWPSNPRAKEGMTTLITLMVERRLADGDARGALHLLAELPLTQRPHELSARVARAALEAERIAALGRAADPRLGAGHRARTIRGLALVWMAIPLLGHLLAADRVPTRAMVYGSAVGLFLVTGGMVALLRRSLGDSSLSRKLSGWLLATPALQGLQAVGLDLMGVDAAGMLSSQFFLWGVMVSTSSLAVDLRLLLPGLTYLLTYVFAVRAPEARYLFMAVPNTVLGVTVLWIYESMARRETS